MPNILYTLTIYPIRQFIELCYLFTFRVFHNPSLALFGISLAVSIGTLPLYFVAEKWQTIERETQKKLKPGIDHIKRYFHGDKRFMILSTYYRQNHYHPIYALRSSLGLLIQIPFFIAAYSFLNHLEALQGTPFLFIRDLGTPDSLLTLGAVHVNILPIVMTLLNCVSGTIYTKGFAVKEKVQVYGMAAIFLVLLYNSPAGLVIYWTANQAFSLVKNIVQKMPGAKKIVFFTTGAFLVFLDMYVLFFHDGALIKRLVICAGSLFILALPFIVKRLQPVCTALFSLLLQDSRARTRQFFLSALTLFVLAGVVIPAMLIASSVQEFSFLDTYTSPFPFIWNTALQAAGIFLFWAVCVYFLFSPRVQTGITVALSVAALAAVCNTVLFSGNYGDISIFLKFSVDNIAGATSRTLDMLNALTLLAITLALILSFRRFYRKALPVFFTVLLGALCVVSIWEIKNIRTDFTRYVAQRQYESGLQASHSKADPVFTFSAEGKNVLVIGIDRGISGYIPYIFDEKPELHQKLSGFTWYRNSIAFSAHTFFSAPAVFGGYEYTPLEMQKRNTELLGDKFIEASLVLPRIFSEHNFSVTVTDPALNIFSPRLWSSFNAYPKIKAQKISGVYLDEWVQPNKELLSYVSLPVPKLTASLLSFAFFKCSPLILRSFMYDNGDYFTMPTMRPDESMNFLYTLEAYSTLDVLPSITAVEHTEISTFMFIWNYLPHEAAFFQVPEYVPRKSITNKGSGPFAEENHYHVNVATYMLLGKWFDYLKTQGVYDNTRIIIVSDHGAGLHSPFPDNIDLPDDSYGLEAYTAVLMVKDFNAKGNLLIDNTFMTHADVPLLATGGLIDKPINPFTGKVLTTQKDAGVTITTPRTWMNTGFTFDNIYTYNIGSGEWLHVHNDIYKPENWSRETHPVEIVERWNSLMLQNGLIVPESEESP